MKNIFLFILIASFLIISCGDQKKPEAKTDAKPEETKTDLPKDEKASSLDELVYEATGSSRLKTESASRGASEANGRGALVKVLAEDAVAMTGKFAELNKDAFAAGFDKEKMNAAIHEFFKKPVTLKGSSVSEYTKSANKDTTYALMEMPLMSGYEVIEAAIADAGASTKFIKDMDAFKKAFKAFYLEDKKKALTVPS